MFKVYKFKYIGDYGGGMGIVAASSLEEAKSIVKEWSKDFWEEYEVSKELQGVQSNLKGILCYDFYHE